MITREGIKTHILDLISQGPIKATEIASDPLLIKSIIDSKLDVDIGVLLNELVEQKRIVEIEYVLPQMHYRIKSLYLPKGTEISIKGAVDQ